MGCTTILVGKKATNDGSTLIARNEDGFYDVKKMIVVMPKDQPRKYRTVISHLQIDLPDDPLRYTAMPNVSKKEGIWAAHGINSANVGMTATETITTNPRVLAADPLVRYHKAESKKEKDIPGGIGEEDMVTIVLPYIRSAREGVIRLGSLLEQYGTYETNGIAFNDENEVWWLESIGGHHWIAVKVKDDEYVIAPNQFSMDRFDLEDALGEQKENMCSKDLKEFIEDNHLNCNINGTFNPRLIFGSHSDQDHIYNTPRAWYMARYFNPRTYKWDGEDADYTPLSNDIPFALKPEFLITVEDVKYILSSHYQGTPYNPYSNQDTGCRAAYRSIGINRTGSSAILQIRNNVPDEIKGIHWCLFGSMAFNAAIPLYANVDRMPDYVAKVTEDATTDNFYWHSRYIAALAEPHYANTIQMIERYQSAVPNKARQLMHEAEAEMLKNNDFSTLDKINEKICKECSKIAQHFLNEILFEATKQMKNGFNRADN